MPRGWCWLATTAPRPGASGDASPASRVSAICSRAGSASAAWTAARRASYAHMTVDAVSDLDLSYTPPLGSPWDAIQIGAQTWTRHTRPH
jgi:hypothetical protein